MKRRSFLRHAFESLLLLCGGVYPWSAALAKPEMTVQRIAFGSCANQEEPQPIWNVISEAKPDLFLFIGDNIYADTEDMTDMAKKYKRLGSKPEYAKFRTSTPVLAIWDDHDYGINDGGAEFPKKQESKKLMLDFFNEPVDSARRKREGIYTSYYFGPPGKRLQVILLDLRWFRSPLTVQKEPFAYLPTKDPNATMLGAEQWKWFEAELKKPADLRLIASSTQFASPEHPWEKWSNYPNDRERMVKLIDDLKLRNLFFISGDMHYGELSAEKTPGGFEIWDLTSSGMNLFENGSQYKNSNRVALHDTSANFGFIEIDWQKDGPSVSLQVRTDKGASPIKQNVKFA